MGKTKKSMLFRSCPKCGSTKVWITAIIKDDFNGAIVKKEIIYDFATGMASNDFIIEIVKIINCATCAHKYNEDKWKIIPSE